jgi:predicted esterase
MRQLRFAVALASSSAVVLGSLAIAGEPRSSELTSKGQVREDLRAIANAYADDGDLAKALAALAEKKAKPLDLLATLRSPAPPTIEAKAGEQELKIKDGAGTESSLFVWAPPAAQLAQHTREKKPLGLAVLLHGLGGKGSNARPVANEILATGDYVVVAPSAQPYGRGEGPEDGLPALMTKTFKHWWVYESDQSFVFQAIKQAKAQFPIDPERVCLAGASMGGFGAWNVGLRHVDRFSCVAELAGGLSRLTSFTGMKHEPSWALLENGLNLPFFAAHGDKDSVVPYAPDKAAADALKSLGGDIDFRTLEGMDHDLGAFKMGQGTLMADLKSFLTTKKRRSSPEKVVYVSISEKLDGAYWLRVAARGKKQAIAKLEGTIDRKANRVELTASDVVTARVYCDDRVLDLAREVKVVVGGQEVARRRVEPDFRAILESWRSRRDERLVYPAFIEVDARELS